MGADDTRDGNGRGALSADARSLLAELEDVILLARIAPGQRVTIAGLSAIVQQREADVAPLLRFLEADGLVAVAGDRVEAAPLARDAIFAALPRRIQLEIAIARAATVNASAGQIAVMRESEAVQRRCALIGDMDGLMRAERQLEAVLVEASGLHEEGCELKRLKRDFRRAWCAANRLRTFSNVANIRTAFVAAIASGDPAEAEAQVRVFFDHLMRTY